MPSAPAHRRPLPLVLLPGTLCDQRVWGAHADSIGAEREVIVPTIGIEPNLSAEAKRLLHFLPERFVLGGFSLGAMVAFELIRQAAQRIAGLVIVSSVAREDRAENATRRLAQLARFRAGDTRGLLDQELLPGYFSPGAAAEQKNTWRELVVAMALATPEQVFGHQVTYAINRPDSLQTLLDLRVPVQVQCGDQDLLCSPAQHVAMANACRDATLVCFPDCGHFLPLEVAPSSIIRMKKWLQNIERDN